MRIENNKIIIEDKNEILNATDPKYRHFVNELIGLEIEGYKRGELALCLISMEFKKENGKLIYTDGNGVEKQVILNI